ncbi:fam-i protein [Plasmodium gallinaceum]|uniref:Fam-i protein n=1 Tax=Plasmodium gallinaceum TaxID=5849 RepID=A0A1J1GY39_PLAGA|nr:fam-i protein [Plasmodium gallinaceum]CRG97400.1 fam-i protein [Plasmodium gallinaceum]
MDLNLSDAISIDSNKRLNEGESTASFAHRAIKDATVSIPENPLLRNLNSRDAIQNPSKDINLDSATSINVLHKKSLNIFQLVIIIIFFLRFKRAHSPKLKAKHEMNVRLQTILDNSNKKMKRDLEKKIREEEKNMEKQEKKLLKKKKKIEEKEKRILREKEMWEKRTLKEKQECDKSKLKELEEWEKLIIKKGENWKKEMIIEKIKLENEIQKNKEEGEKRMLEIIEKFEKEMLKEKKSGKRV